MPTPTFDFLDILQTFAEHKADFTDADGVSAVLHSTVLVFLLACALTVLERAAHDRS